MQPASLEAQLLKAARAALANLVLGNEYSTKLAVGMCDGVQIELRQPNVDATTHARVAAELYRTRGLALLHLGAVHEAIADLAAAVRYMDDNFVRTEPHLLQQVTQFALLVAHMRAALPAERPNLLDGYERKAATELLQAARELEGTFAVLTFGNLAPLWRVRTRVFIQRLEWMQRTIDRADCRETLRLLNDCQGTDDELRAVCEWFAKAGYFDPNEGEPPAYAWERAIMESLKVFADHRTRYPQ